MNQRPRRPWPKASWSKTDSKGRLRVYKEQRKAVLAEFEQSGMSATKFAAVAGIKYSTLAGWLQPYRRVKPRVPSKGVRFIEAVIGPHPSKEPGIQAWINCAFAGCRRVE